jgi:hypothetical protein
MYEAHTSQGPWLTQPRRMLRHRAMVQCARTCFGLGGLYEPDEAERVRTSLLSVDKPRNNRALTSGTKSVLCGRPKPLGASVLKELIQQSCKAGGDGSLRNGSGSRTYVSFS